MPGICRQINWWGKIRRLLISLGVTMALNPDTLAHFVSIGPAGVKREIALGKHGQAPDSPLWREAELWIESELIRLNAEADAKRDAREERTLAITESALAIAKESAASAQRAASAAEAQCASAERQAKWAWWAAIIAMIAAISATSAQINDLITWLQK